MCGLASDSDSFCTVTVARRISQVKILLDRNHMHMGRQRNIRIIKNSCADHLTLAAAEFCSFFLKTDTFICINIFLSRNCKKRKASAELLSGFLYLPVPLHSLSLLPSVRDARRHVPHR